MNVLVLHHADPDGIASGLVAKRYEESLGGKVETMSCQYGMPMPKEKFHKFDRITMVDFTFPMEEMSQIELFPSKQFIVVDHHERVFVPTFRNIKSLVVPGGSNRPEDKKAGVDLAMEMFPVSFSDNEKEILFHIGRRDVWDFSHSDTEMVANAIFSYEQSIESYENILRTMTVKDLVNEGKAIVRYRDNCISSIIRNSEEVLLNGRKCLACNTPFSVSETGHVLAQLSQSKGLEPIGVTYFWIPTLGAYNFSLRSIGEVDVSEIAKQFGGGGHRNASGFQSKTLPWRPV